jgi:hypothetical protein
LRAPDSINASTLATVAIERLPTKTRSSLPARANLLMVARCKPPRARAASARDMSGVATCFENSASHFGAPLRLERAGARRLSKG